MIWPILAVLAAFFAGYECAHAEYAKSEED